MHNGSANKITAFAYAVRVRLERKVNRRLLSSKLLIINYKRILLLAYESDFTSLKVSDTVNLIHSLRTCSNAFLYEGLFEKWTESKK